MANDTSQGASNAAPTTTLAEILAVLSAPEPAAASGNPMPEQNRAAATMLGQGYGGGGGGDAVATAGYGGLLVIGLIAIYLVFKGA